MYLLKVLREGHKSGKTDSVRILNQDIIEWEALEYEHNGSVYALNPETYEVFDLDMWH
jgi:hypothetical protein